jgi:hypothetical protein
MPITTARDEVRFELGDVQAANPLFNDDELDYLLGQHADNVLLTAAHACDILATRFARGFEFSDGDDRTFKPGERVAHYRTMARDLRERASTAASGGLAVIETTRVDGYSDDLSSRDGSFSTQQGRRPWPYDTDMP